MHAASRRRSLRAAPSAMNAWIAAFVAALLVAACGGGGGSSTPAGDGGGTPPFDAATGAGDATANDVAYADGGDVGATCGDGVCAASEGCAVCAADCGACGPTPQPGELVVTEIMYDPTAVSDASGEWFELHNPSADTAYHLGECAIRIGADGADQAIGDLTVEPGAWLVLARRATENGGLAPAFVFSAGSLSNSGDTVAILCGPAASRWIVDAVAYAVDGGWPTARGASLSLSAGALSASANDEPAAWCVAAAPYGDGDRGTPGEANPTCAPPSVCDDGTCADDETCEGCPLDCGACGGCGNGTCEPEESCEGCPVDCQACPGCGDTDCGTDETCASCPADCGACGPTPGAGDLVITEILYDPAAVSDTRGEWFEVHNPGATDFALDGCVVAFGPPGDSATRVVTGVTLPAGGWQVFARNAEDNGGLPPGVHAYGGLSLANGGDTVTLSCGPAGAQVIVDTVAYGVDEPWPTGSGKALSLSAGALTAAANDAATAWCLATTPYGAGDLGTPGAPNPACPVGPVCGDLSCDPGETCGACPADCDPCAPTPAAGDLVVSEIHYDPSAVSDTAGEWFEMHNPGAEPRTLDGCVIEIGAVGAGSTRVVSGVTIPPGGWQVFARSATDNGGLPAGVFAYGGLSLGNSGDTVTLHCGPADARVVVDTVTYGTAAPWPKQAGASLNLSASSITATANDDGSAWCLANVAYGAGDLGTPGGPNRDCAGATGCGDETCDAGESCVSCPGDCGPCGPRARAGDLVITEVMQNPAAVSDANGEWFELFNPSDTLTYDLAGCVLSDRGGDRHVLAAPVGIGPRVHMVFAASAAPGFEPHYVWTGSFSLGNGADQIVLTCDDIEVDVVAWDGGPTFPSPSGASMSLDPFFYWSEPGADAVVYNDDGEAWCAAPDGFFFESGDRGTPGSPNPDCPLP